jgi:hypothetical protein
VAECKLDSTGSRYRPLPDLLNKVKNLWISRKTGMFLSNCETTGLTRILFLGIDIVEVACIIDVS